MPVAPLRGAPLSTFLNLLASGVAMGAVYALGALGFLVLYKTTGVVNFAQGDLMTLGAYLSFWGVTSLHLGPTMAALLAILLAGATGVLIERVAYAPLRSRPHLTVIISTLGVALIIRALLGVWLGTSPITVQTPVGHGTFGLGDVLISRQRVLVVVVSVVIVAVLLWVFARTQLGRMVRALASDADMAQLVGVRVRGVSMVAFGVSAALAALAGVLVAPLAPVTLTFGFSIMLGSFAAAILGGFGNLAGVVGAGLILGIVEQTIGAYVFRDYAELYPFLLMVAVIALRPQGLFSRGVDARL